MKYNLSAIMRRAWELRKVKGLTLCTALKLAWGETKGVKLYTFALESERAAISAYLVKLRKALCAGLDDIHAIHKYDCIRAALAADCDTLGIATLDGKNVRNEECQENK